MSQFVRSFPALSLFVLALALGMLPLGPVVAGILPPGFFQLAALSASTAGIVLAAIDGGKASVRELLARVLVWRVGAGWWLFAILFPAIPSVGALYLASLLGGRAVEWADMGSLYTIVPALLIMIVFAGLGEEFGWRGFAIPRMGSRHKALAIGLIIGVFHATWHTPLFFVDGVIQHTMAQEVGLAPAFLGYSLFVIALSVQLTWLFVNTKGSVLLVAVYHGAVNAWNGYVDIYRGQMTGIYVYTALTVMVSIALVIIFGADRLPLSRAVPAPGKPSSTRPPTS
jgi:membrane protease YdiL (CAAX protease family)